jgi:hypothetical protein
VRRQPRFANASAKPASIQRFDADSGATTSSLDALKAFTEETPFASVAVVRFAYYERAIGWIELCRLPRLAPCTQFERPRHREIWRGSLSPTGPDEQRSDS